MVAARRDLARGTLVAWTEALTAGDEVDAGGGMNAETDAMSLKSESLALDRTSTREPVSRGCMRRIIGGASVKAVSCRSRSMSSTLTGPLIGGGAAGGGGACAS